MSGCNRTRRRLLSGSLTLPVLPVLPALAGLSGCSSPLPRLATDSTSPDARALLMRSAEAHGLAAFSGLTDLSVSYRGHWRALVDKLQPDLVDAKFRGESQERMLLRETAVGQAFTGPGGHKHVARRVTPGTDGEVRVWFNDDEAHDKDRRDAAALVPDGYALFLLGPLLLARNTADRKLILELAPPAGTFDVLRVRLTPGLGLSTADDVALYIDRDEHLMRRVRITLNGLESTQGAIAEIDCFDHVSIHGVRWPTRFHEKLLRPFPLPVHDWHLTGLDVNRGFDRADIEGAAFGARAAAPAGLI
jgi:hypothetical protein